MYYIGHGKVDKKSKDYAKRKELGLPVRKDLVYYDVKNNFEKRDVYWYKVVAGYETCDIIALYLEDGSVVLIHSKFFSDMQQPKFIRDYLESMKGEQV